MVSRPSQRLDISVRAEVGLFVRLLVGRLRARLHDIPQQKSILLNLSTATKSSDSVAEGESMRTKRLAH